jgi:hypothetical protein
MLAAAATAATIASGIARQPAGNLIRHATSDVSFTNIPDYPRARELPELHSEGICRQAMIVPSDFDLARVGCALDFERERQRLHLVSDFLVYTS